MPKTNAITSFDWAPEIESNLIDFLDLPKSSPITFPLDEFAAKLSELFGWEDFKISAEDMKLVAADTATSLFDKAQTVQCSYAPLESHFFWVVNKKDMSEMLAWTMQEDANYKIEDPTFLLGFQNFLALEAIKAISDIGFAADLTLRIEDRVTNAIAKSALVCDITIMLGKKKAISKLIFPSEFVESWQKYSEPKKPTEIPDDLRKSLELTLRLQIGSTQLSMNEWKGAMKGDFIVLDRCTVDPETGVGNLTFSLEEKPLFRGKIKGQEVKILEYPFDTIGESAMEPFDEEESPNEPEGELEDESWLDEGPELEGTPELPTLPESATPESTTPEEPALPKEAPTLPETETLKPPMVPEKIAVSSDRTKLAAPEEIPLTMTVEVGRIQLSAEKIMNLKPGQTLELGVDVKNGVDCYIGGKRVAKGDIVKIGELLGVRITELKRSKK